MPEHRHAALYRELTRRAYEQGDESAIDDLLAPSYRRDDACTPAVDAGGLKAQVREVRAGLSGVRYQIEHAVADDAHLAVRWRLSGEHTGPLFGVPASGRGVSIEGASFLRVEGGRFTSTDLRWDSEALRRQIGADRAGYAAVEGGELSYEVCGLGAPVLLMHGGLGLDHGSLMPVANRLARFARAFAYDHRGCGRSTRSGLENASLDTFADDAEALRRSLGLGKVIVLGHSYGAYVALTYALRHPSSVAGLVLCNAGAAAADFGAGVAEAKRRASPEVVSALTEGLAKLPESDDGWRAVWRQILPLYFHRPDPALIDDLDARTIYSAAALRQGFAALAGFDVRKRLGEIEARTLVVAGSDDWLDKTGEAAEVLASGIAGAKLVRLDGCGHFPSIEQPEAFASAVGSFVRGR